MILIAALALAARPVAVMIHGAGGGGWEWDIWKPVFQREGWDVVARDLVPVKGGLKKTRFEDYVQQVADTCPKDRPFILVGASMGGPIALKVAERTHPSAVVLVNAVPATGTGGKRYPDVIRWANGPLQDSIDSMPDSSPAVIHKAWKLWRDESGAVLRTISAGVHAKEPACPVLVVIGDKDTDVNPKLSHEVAVRYQASIREYKGMSHVGPFLGTRAPKVAHDVLAWASPLVRH